ncbi:MAG: hypothetical protein D3924_14870, partial [Candidatus Electrothrix sp. AR4]|nr:hypothetical protein [Candidatus Electrothrix sp. AR4]
MNFLFVGSFWIQKSISFDVFFGVTTAMQTNCNQQQSEALSPASQTEHNQYRKYAPNAIQSKYFTIVFLFSIALLGLVLWPFWQLLILAFLLAGIFRPVYNWLRRWVSPWMASCLTCALVALIVFIPLTFCIGALSSEALNVYQLGRNTNLLLKLQLAIQNSEWVAQAQEALQGFGINFQPSDITEISEGWKFMPN